jgi:hypothetical protein
MMRSTHSRRIAPISRSDRLVTDSHARSLKRACTGAVSSAFRQVSIVAASGIFLPVVRTRSGRKRTASDATTTADRFLKRENAFSAQAADTNKQVLCDFLTVPTRVPSAVSTLVHVNFGEHPSDVESISQLALADGVNKNPHRSR